MLTAVVKNITPCYISKAHIKQLLTLRTSKTSQSQINPTRFYNNTCSKRLARFWFRHNFNTTLIMSELVKMLKLKGKQRKLNITSAISTSVSVTSKLVEFSICSSHHPEQIEVKNAWVFDSLNLPSQCILKVEIQRK